MTKNSLSYELRRIQEQVRRRIQDLEDENAQLKEQFERAEAERQNTLIARQEDQERWQREQKDQVLDIVSDLLRSMGKDRMFILDMLEMHEKFSTQDILAELKRWIRDVSGQRPSRFPSEAEAPGGYITLTPDELNDPDRGFNVENERPFAEGQERVTFKLVRRGWRLGTEILHPARLSASGVQERSTASEDEGV